MALKTLIRGVGPPAPPDVPAAEDAPLHAGSSSMPATLPDEWPSPAAPACSREEMKRLKLCSYRGDYKEVERAVEWMVVEGIPRDAEVMKTLLHAYCKAREVERAEHYLRHMEELGFVVDVVPYNSVINANAVVGNAENAIFWFQRMLSMGHQATDITYGTLCKALGTAGDARGVEDLMSKIEESGGQLSEYHFASLISACDKTHPPDTVTAKRALVRLVSRGLKPDSVQRVFFRVVGETQGRRIFASLAPKTAGGVAKRRTGSPERRQGRNFGHRIDPGLSQAPHDGRQPGWSPSTTDPSLYWQVGSVLARMEASGSSASAQEPLADSGGRGGRAGQDAQLWPDFGEGWPSRSAGDHVGAFQ